MFANAFQGKTIWLSGHTGFKGAWLARWLVQLGARVRRAARPDDHVTLKDVVGKNLFHVRRRRRGVR